MPASSNHRKLTLRIYEEADADLVTWLDSMKTKSDTGDQIKQMLRLGLGAQNGSKSKKGSDSVVTKTTLDGDEMMVALRRFLPEIRAVMEAALQSVSIAVPDGKKKEEVIKDVPDEMLAEHLGDDDEDEP